MMAHTSWAALLASGLLLAGVVPAAPNAAAPPEAAPNPAAILHPLDAADLNAWLDGYMPYALAVGDIAGAVVVVVKNGEVLIARGYGYADVKAQKPIDPERTLFRPGSVSKLFTWTAVMQLVESGRLDLDADINTYLDFRIPPREGAPITLRQLMTHTSGFEETAKHLFASDAAHVPALDAVLKVWVPERVFAPGHIPAYSNYGAALAGYIVQRVSGEPFAAYIDRHIFKPLGMEHSTFVQPLPPQLLPDMSLGYARASSPAKPYELIGPTPAGSAASTGADMARFMIAHLQQGRYGGAQILKPETAQLMHTQVTMPTPPFPGMALGFYRADRNGHIVLDHGGDTELFHSDLHLFLDDGVGLFISMNSMGLDGAAAGVRVLLFREFADRYFPAAPAPALPTLASAPRDAALIAGNYWGSRRSDSNFLLIASLAGQVSIKALPDGTLETPRIQTPGHGVKRWREVGPQLWQQIGGRTLLKAVLKDGRVDHFTLDEIPAIEVLQPVPVAFNAVWNLPLFYASTAVLLWAVLSWPIAALIRRRYQRPFPLAGRAALLHRVVRVTALVDLLSLAGWMTLLASLESHISLLNDPLNPWLRLLQLLGVLGLLGALAAMADTVVVWRDTTRSRWAKLVAVLLALACLDMAWLILLLRLVGPSVNF